MHTSEVLLRGERKGEKEREGKRGRRVEVTIGVGREIEIGDDEARRERGVKRAVAVRRRIGGER